MASTANSGQCRNKYGGEPDPRLKIANDKANEKRRCNGKAKEWNDVFNPGNNEERRLNGKRKEWNDS